MHLGELVASFKGKHHTEESKKKTSESRKAYLDKHPEQVPYLLNHSSKVSYPEKYFAELFKNENIQLQYHKQIYLYQLDFCNEQTKKYIEIDGATHDQEKVHEKDLRRDKWLAEQGWIGMRIKWSDWKNASLEDQKVIIEKIREFVNS